MKQIKTLVGNTPQEIDTYVNAFLTSKNDTIQCVYFHTHVNRNQGMSTLYTVTIEYEEVK